MEDTSSIFCIFLIFLCLQICVKGQEALELKSTNSFTIEGRVEVFSNGKNWLPNTRILVDGGEYIGFLRSDGSFTINGVPSGSFVVEVVNPSFLFEPARVDITSKGKIRARKVNYLQPSVVKVSPYPLEFRERGKANYFQAREQWRITDFLFNPMVLTMVLPLLLIMVLPKLLNTADPDTQKEVQSQMNALNSKQNMPDVSEMFTNLFSGGQKKPVKAKPSAKQKR
ncbi:hypothetical protein LOTGIDRAFT_203638 [Lottia gigantea]|uniref:ER membrane protein complex subunit 7 beta-sandwich domain-containing protein n=1 Tax=Lottia gigantea TaxID=225164 RepID=V4B195_LOTGI|nr:hypothetical protein LOTGIDRAFT_203638 [Lottia gigantea]ESP00062.1 hypothetical protein LOTGIDRAFT_203638 [Lottia gigantea]